MHEVRVAYGWTDEQIVEQVDLYGIDWLLDVWTMIREDMQRERAYLYNLIPLSQTPGTKEMVHKMDDYGRKLWNTHIQAIVPRLPSGDGDNLDHLYTLTSPQLREKIGRGNVAVILSSGERGDLPLFRDARTLKD
jgi:hypothetical protein